MSEFSAALLPTAGTEVHIIKALSNPAKIFFFSNMYYYDDPVHVENIHMGHTQILENIKAGDFDEAANIMRLHLQYNMVYALNAYHKAPKAIDTFK